MSQDITLRDVRHGFAIHASVDEQEQVILRLAAGEVSREAWTAWLEAHLSRVRGYDERQAGIEL